MKNTAIIPLARPTALLLGGGGAKGAFQIGAWEALAEANLLGGIQMTAGCSVGALNAVLFALGDLALAKHIWESITPADLLSPVSEGAFFSREGLVRLIRSLPLEKVRSSPICISVCVQHLATKQPVFFELNGLSDDSIVKLLLASSAIPRVYAPVTYLGAEYADGSVTAAGDLGISPAYAKGHRDLLIVSLRHTATLYGGQGSGALGSGGDPCDLTVKYPDCRITLVKPIRPLGKSRAVSLDFSEERLRAHMEQGCADTRTALTGVLREPKTREEMNFVLTQKLRVLLPTGDAFAAFAAAHKEDFLPNLRFPTLGGKVWYDTLYAADGWRLQQQRTAGLKSHYRILNPRNRRAAWFLKPETLLAALGCEY